MSRLRGVSCNNAASFCIGRMKPASWLRIRTQRYKFSNEASFDLTLPFEIEVANQRAEPSLKDDRLSVVTEPGEIRSSLTGVEVLDRTQRHIRYGILPSLLI